MASSDVHVDPYMEGVSLVVGALTLALGAWLLIRRSFRAALFLAVAIGGALVLSTALKELVARPPIEGPADEHSFPSGTATWAAATATALVLLARTRRERLVAAAAGVALAVGMGLVIVWEEWHYPSDVVAGWSLAIAWAVAVWLALGSPLVPPVDSRRRTGDNSVTRREERPAAAPSVPAAESTGGTEPTT